METSENCLSRKPLVLYPLYFDSSCTTSNGRRIPKNLAKKSPLARDLLAAVQSCGFQAELEKDKFHPKASIGSGRIKVFNVTESKNSFMLKVASNLKVSSSIENIPVASSSSPASASTSVQISPNLIYQVRSKKKKNRENK